MAVLKPVSSQGGVMTNFENMNQEDLLNHLNSLKYELKELSDKKTVIEYHLTNSITTEQCKMIKTGIFKPTFKITEYIPYRIERNYQK